MLTKQNRDRAAVAWSKRAVRRCAAN